MFSANFIEKFTLQNTRSTLEKILCILKHHSRAYGLRLLLWLYIFWIKGNGISDAVNRSFHHWEERHKDSLTIGSNIVNLRVTFLPFRFYIRDTSRNVIRVYFIASSIDDCSSPSDHKIARGVWFIDISIQRSLASTFKLIDLTKASISNSSLLPKYHCYSTFSLSLSLSNFSILLYFCVTEHELNDIGLYMLGNQLD